MKRRNFLLTSLLAAPAITYARIKKLFIRKPFKVDGGKDRFNEPFIFRDARFNLKVSGKDTDGDLCIYDTFRQQNSGPTLHKHFAQDEWFFVMKGEYAFKIGDDMYYLKEGDSLFGPRNIPHVFIQTSEGEGRLMLTYQPAGSMEGYFKEASTKTNATEEEKKALMLKHGMEPLGGPLKV